MWTSFRREVPPVKEIRPTQGRLHYLDSIRVLLSVLVVAHHAAQPYGPPDWWYVEDQPRTTALADFAVLNAPWKMSLFFMIAAFVLPRAVDRRRDRPYLGPRLRKLGGPVLIGFFVVLPVLMYSYYLNFRGYGPIGFLEYYRDIYLGAGDRPPDWSGPIWPDRQFGHLWFLQHLLVYSLLYLAWRAIAERTTSRENARTRPRPLKGWTVLVFTAVVATGTFVLRLWYPADEWVPVLEFIQTEPADLAQHVPFVVAGVLAYRYGWFEGLSRRLAYSWLAAAVACCVGYVLLPDGLLPVAGGASLAAAATAIGEAVLCVGFSLGVLVFFRDHLSGTGPIRRSAAAATFAVYLLHLPIVVGLQYLVAGTPLGAEARFTVVTLCGVILSVAIAAVLQRVPLVRSIL